MKGKYMKKRKAFFTAMMAAIMLTSSETVFVQALPVQEAELLYDQKTVVDPAKKEGLQITDSGITFGANGKKVKKSWINYKGSRYYFGADGYAYVGSHKIAKKLYVFDENGCLLSKKKNKLVNVCGKTYYITTQNGNPATGYFVYRQNLYYADSMGVCYQNQESEDGKYYFTEKGTAKRTTDALLKIQTMQILSKITTPKMTRAQKLKACWNYVVDRKRFRYGGFDPDLEEEGWYKENALNMFRQKRGNCYSFACAFAALAQEIGYKNIKLKVSKSTHCWVTINDKHYDPQKQRSGTMKGVYGLKRHPKKYGKLKTYDFK